MSFIDIIYRLKEKKGFGHEFSCLLRIFDIFDIAMYARVYGKYKYRDKINIEVKKLTFLILFFYSFDFFLLQFDFELFFATTQVTVAQALLELEF